MTAKAGYRIFVLGFDTNFCYLLERYGLLAAYAVVFADHDQDVLTQIKTHQPDLIFLEVIHPGSIAQKLMRTIKADRETRRIPIVVCSWQEGQELCYERENADFHLRLPMLYEHFQAALEHIERKK